MLPYVLIDILIVLFGVVFINHHATQRNKKVICFQRNKINIYALLEWGLIIGLALFAACRGAFTSDYQNYCNLFIETADRSFIDIVREDHYVEKGYLILNKVISLITEDGNIAVGIVSVIIVFLFCLNAKKYTKQYWLFLLLFVNIGVYYHSFNLVRQALAASILFAGTPFLIKKKYVKYVIIVLLASFVHTTSIVMLVCIPLLNKKITWKKLSQYAIAGIVAFLSIDVIVEIVQRFKYADYTYGMERGKITAIIVPLLIAVFICFACKMKFIDVNEEENRVFINATIIYVIICILQMKLYQMSRIGYFFSTYSIILCVNCVDGARNKAFRKWLFVLISLLMIAYMYIWLSDTGYNPYYTYWKE